VRVGGDDAFLTLSDFLRRRQGLTGTKVVCAEGDCGSCAVLVGRVEGERIRYAAVTSCIQLVFQLDGRTSSRSRAARRARAERRAAAMVACQGTQCGFCTPGLRRVAVRPDAGGPAVGRARGAAGAGRKPVPVHGYDSIVRAALAVEPGDAEVARRALPARARSPDAGAAARDEVRIETAGEVLQAGTASVRRVSRRAPGCVVDRRRDGHRRGLQQADARDRRRPQHRRLPSCGESSGEATRYVGAGATLASLERARSSTCPELGRFLATSDRR
jgi:hypothetical protein